MYNRVRNLTAVAALAAAMAFGQDAANQEKKGRGRAGHGAMMGRFSADLNLTDAQKQQSQSIFSESRRSARSVYAQLSESRKALAAAVKSGASEAEIDKLSNNLAPLMAQSTAIHTKAFAKFYATLTQEQKDKIGDKLPMMMNGMQGGFRGARGGEARGRGRARQ